MTRREQKWMENYVLLKAYIKACGHLPDKKKVENRGLLNWWKYNRKLTKAGKLSKEQKRLLAELGEMRVYGRNGSRIEPDIFQIEKATDSQ